MRARNVGRGEPQQLVGGAASCGDAWEQPGFGVDRFGPVHEDLEVKVGPRALPCASDLADVLSSENGVAW